VKPLDIGQATGSHESPRASPPATKKEVKGLCEERLHIRPHEKGMFRTVVPHGPLAPASSRSIFRARTFIRAHDRPARHQSHF